MIGWLWEGRTASGIGSDNIESLTGGAEGGLGVRHGRRGMENDGSCMVRQVELERCWQFFKSDVCRFYVYSNASDF